MKQEYLVSAVVVLAIVGGLYLARPTIVVNPPDVVQPPVTEYGAIPGDEVFSQTFTVNGMTQYFYSQNFNNIATSTGCSFRTPSATTSPSYVGMTLKENTAGKSMYVGKGVNNWATTSALISLTATAGTRFNGVASTTLTNGTTLVDNLLGPNQYVNFQIDGATHATGTCRMILRAI